MKIHIFKRGTGSFSAVIYLLFFSLLLSSCTTVTSERVNPRVLLDSDTQIDNAEHLVLKNGSYVTLTDKRVVFKRVYKDYTNVLLVIDPSKYTTVLDSVKNQKNVFYNEYFYPIDSVKEIYVRKTETDATGTVLVVVGSILAAVLLLVAIAAIEFSNHPPHSCPFIYSFDGEKYVMDAEPLGGAVCEGLERTDVSKLENLKNVDGNFKVRVMNANDEQQRIDKLEFFSIRYAKDENAAPDFNGKFYKYRNPVKPLYAVNEAGFDITKFVSENDGARWFNEMPSDTGKLNYTPKETLTIRFPKPKDVKNAMLIINGGASYFGSNMVPEMLKLNGNKVDEVYKSIYPGSDVQKRLFTAMHRDESYYLDIKTNEGPELRNQGIMRSNGPVVVEDILYPLSLEGNNSDFVEIVLTPQRYFWRFDMINIVYDYEEAGMDDIVPMEIISAADGKGVNITDKLQNSDKDYYKMPVTGDYADILLNVPAGFDSETNNVFVAATGWYEINLKKDNERDDKTVENILYSENGLFKYSLSLYKNKLYGIAEKFNLMKVYEN
jgi:hypothetical protein